MKSADEAGGNVRWKPLRSRSFRAFMGGFALDQFADGLWLYTLGWLAAQTGQGIASAMIFVAAAVPSFLLQPLGGLLTDRYGSRRLTVITLICRAAALAVWASVADRVDGSVVVIMVAAATISAIEGFHNSAVWAYPRSLLPDTREIQKTASSLESLVRRLAHGAGPLLGGALTVRFGLGAGPSVGAVALAVAVVIFRKLPRASEPGEAIVRHSDLGEEQTDPQLSLRAGLRYAFQTNRTVAACIVSTGVLNFCVSASIVVGLPLLAGAAGWGAGQFGVVAAAFGVGAGIGNLATSGRDVPLPWLLVANAGTGLPLVVMGLSRGFSVALTCSLLAGGCVGVAAPGLAGYVRAAPPSALVGRVGAVLEMAYGVEPVGYLLFGVTAAAVSTRWSFLGSGVLTVVVACSALVVVLRGSPRTGPSEVVGGGVARVQFLHDVGDVGVEEVPDRHAENLRQAGDQHS